MLGSMQSGRRSSLRLLEVTKHEAVIVSARDEAAKIVDADPLLVEHPALADVVGRLRRDEHSEYLEKA